MSDILIFTDLDGTLLDHDSYVHDEAAGALAVIRQRGIPLILASSKTRFEMLALQAALGIDAPFICENGAAVCGAGGEGGVVLQSFASRRSEVLKKLGALRETLGFRFEGFSDWSVDEIAAKTGLAPAQASLASAREYSEPLCWQDSDARLEEFRQCLVKEGLGIQQGGRFLSVSSRCDKGSALLWLRDYLAPGGVRTVALGDSPNDLDMLCAADIAVIIRSRHSADMDVRGPSQVLRSEQAGPAGWQEIMGPLLEMENDHG